ncbi:MAG: preprotein translocase subunit YajC [Verrucomicrobiota bacterium]
MRKNAKGKQVNLFSALPTLRHRPFVEGFLLFTDQNPLPSMDSFFILAQQPAPPPGGGLTPIIFFILLFAGMWFLIIAPQRKRQKQQEAMIKALKTGDKIITSGGLYGEITNVKDDRLVVKVSDNVKVEVGRTFVATKVDDAS